MEAENEAMINHLRRIELTFPKRLTTFGPPRDVEYVEVLYKSSKATYQAVGRVTDVAVNK